MMEIKNFRQLIQIFMGIGYGSVKKINDGLKRFNLKHRNSEGKVFNSEENIIIFLKRM